jgi:trimeric autotransporter adhesin
VLTVSIKLSSTLHKLGAIAGLAALFAFSGAAHAAGEANGKVLYNQVVSGLNCSNSGCHGTDPTLGKNKILNGKSASVIQSAINNNTGGMGVFSVFTAAQITDIAAYITNPAAANGAPIATPSVTTLNFPTAVAVNSASAASPFTITNTGTAALVISTVTSNTADFTVSGTCANATVAVNANCTINVVFNPKAAGALTGGVTIKHNAGTLSTTVALTGTGTGTPAVTVAPASLAFGTIIQGTPSAAQTATVTNTGTSNLIFSGLALTGTDAGDFSLGNAAGSCTATSNLAPAAKCTVVVTFTPKTAVAKTASVSITHNATGSPTAIALTGSGGAANPAITATPAALPAFGSTTLGTSAATQQISLKNTGQAPMTFSSFAWSGTNAADFSQTNMCPVSPATLAVGASCTVTVGFTPAAPLGTAARSATLTVNSNASNSPALAIAATGTAVTASVPSIIHSPAGNVTFSATTVNTSATAKAVTLTNNGQAPLTISGITLGGTNAAEFSQTNTCTAPLAVNGTCVVTVGFKPTTVGTGKTATVTVASNASNNASYPITVTGDAVASPVASISSNTTSLTFASTTVGASAATQTLTVTNTATANAAGQSAALSITGVTVTGANAADFTQTNTCPASLAAAATCTITVKFSPAAVGARAANVAIASNASNAASYVVGLSGTGTAAPTPAMTPSVTTLAFGNQLSTTSATQSVTITNTGSADLTVTKAVASNATFTVANLCTAAVAPNGTCIINVTFTPTAAGAISGSLTISGTNVTDAIVSLSGTGTVSTGTGADAVNGQKLYDKNCAGCHGSNPASNISNILRGLDGKKTQSAINGGVASMKTPELLALTTKELNDITAYIGAQAGQPTTPISTDPSAPGAAPGVATNVGGGGCTIGTTNTPFDPLLILMAGISLALIVRRQIKR